MINVRWHDAKAYVAWISNLTGQRYRLLTEAEWEYAARAGEEQKGHSFDLARIHHHAWYEGNSGNRPNPVGLLRANRFGLKDMHGNVAEWVEDCFFETYHGAPRTEEARTGDGDCDMRVARGGHWLSGTKSLRSATRDRFFHESDDLDHVGFRIAREISVTVDP